MFSKIEMHSILRLILINFCVIDCGAIPLPLFVNCLDAIHNCNTISKYVCNYDLQLSNFQISKENYIIIDNSIMYLFRSANGNGYSREGLVN